MGCCTGGSSSSNPTRAKKESSSSSKRELLALTEKAKNNFLEENYTEALKYYTKIYRHIDKREKEKKRRKDITSHIREMERRLEKVNRQPGQKLSVANSKSSGLKNNKLHSLERFIEVYDELEAQNAHLLQRTSNLVEQLSRGKR